MELSQLFVINLKKWRKRRGISQKTLAERCNTSHSYIRQIESKKGHPSFVFIGKLADALNIEPYQLFFNDSKVHSGMIEESKCIESIKSDFLKKIADEFDTAIDKLKT